MSIIDYPDGSTNANALVLTDGSTQLQVTFGAATQSGVISETGGSFGLEKIGSGSLIFTADNTYTGVTTISDGTLQIGNGSPSGNVLGNIVNNSLLVFDRANALNLIDVTYSGIISGTGALLTSGALILTGANTYTGGTTITAGTLRLQNGGNVVGNIVNNGVLQLDQPDGYVLNSNISGSGYLSAINIAGTVTLTGNNTYTGGTLISPGGSLQIGNGGTSGSIVGDIDIGNTGTVIFNRSDDITFAGSISLNGNIVKRGAGALVLSGPVFSGNATVTAGTLQFGNGGAAVSSGGVPSAYMAGISNSGTVVVDYNNTFDIRGVISGNGGVSQIGTGTLLLSGANTYTGGTTISAGTLQLGAGGSLVTTGALTVNGGSFDLAGHDQTVGALSGTGGTINANGGYLTTVNNADATFAGTITGTGGLNKGGTGTLTLTGANTYAGGTMINAGTLKLGASNSLPANSWVQIIGTAALDLNNNDLTLSAVTGSSFGRVLLGSATLSIVFNGTQKFLDGAISGTGGLVKGGDGLLYVLQSNTYSGGTTISGGGLMLGVGATTGSIAGDVTDNAALTFNRSDSVTFSGTISGTGSIAQIGSGTLYLTGNNTYAGGTVISQGTLSLASASNIGAGDIQMYTLYSVLRFNASLSMAQNIQLNHGTLSTDANTNVTLSGLLSTMAGTSPISGFGGFSKIGAGTLTLTANNTYVGATDVVAGTLLVDGSTASSAVTVETGATLGGAGTVGKTSIQSGGTLAPGDGIGTLQVNGNLTLASGALFAEELSPATADEIIVSGNASVAGNLTANFSGGSYGHQTFTILHSSGTLSGTFANFSVTGLPAGLTAGLSYGAHDVTLTTDHAPATTTANLSAVQGQSIALSNLISVSDADGDAITQYQLWDSNGNGYFAVNGAAQPAHTVITISAAQLAQTTYVAGTASDNLQIRAFDGFAWSAADNAPWSPFTVSVRSNSPPQVSTTTQRVAAGQSVALSSLATVTDADGDTITRYQLWDSTRDPNSGHWMVNGQAQAAGTVIDITAAQLGQTSFFTGTVNDNLQVRAFDGIAWSDADTASWAPFTIGPTVNNAPVVTTSNRSIARGVTTALSSLITVSDADGDAMTEYQLWDGSRDPNSGHFVVNGQVQAAGTVIDISAAQLAQTSFVTGSLGDSLQIRAFDGISWSAADTAAWSPFSVSVPDAAPVVTTNNVTKAHLQSYALSSLFSVTDADGDTMTRYQLWDSTRDPNSGHFVVNGQVQAAGTVIDITAAQLAQTSFFTGTVGDNLQIRALDGIAWSDADTASWAPFTITIPANNPPVVSTGTVNAMHGRTLALSGLFSVTDADNDAITRYQLWDSTRDPLSGHFVVNGVAQAAGTVIDITAAQLNQTSFATGQVSDSLQIRAFDGIDWSDADNAPWKPFNVSVTSYTGPSLSTQDVSIAAGQSLALSGLINVTDLDGDSMTKYELWDSTRDPNSGSWVVNGQVQAAGTVIDITAAQLAQTSFLAGTAGIVDSLQVRAFDGISWTAADTAAWAPFHVTAT